MATNSAASFRATVTTGNGDDEVSMVSWFSESGSRLTMKTGNGADQVYFEDTESEAGAKYLVDLGGDNDELFLQGLADDDFEANGVLKGGKGTDDVVTEDLGVEPGISGFEGTSVINRADEVQDCVFDEFDMLL